MLRFYSPVCELEAQYKFITDIFLLSEQTDWALQSFILLQALVKQSLLLLSSSEWMRSAPVFDVP